MRDRRPLPRCVASLRGQGERETERVLRSLAANADPVVRAWAATAAAPTLPGRAERLLRPLLDDHDLDVRDVALEELRSLDLSLLEREVPRLRKQLQSDDIFEPVSALWTLAELGAISARDDVVKVVRQPHEPFHARVAEIVLAVLDRDEQAITRRLEAHDHEAVPWLVYAARILGTPGARQAVEAVAAAAPDDECRQAAVRALRRWDGS
jgi:hypothetical protein